MGKVHVLDTVGGLTRIVCHIDVPAGNNSAGTAWTVVIINSGMGGTTTLTDGAGTGGTISSAEKTSITSGTVFEVEDRVQIPLGLNATQANAFLDAIHAAKVVEVQTQVVARLNYFGFTR